MNKPSALDLWMTRTSQNVITGPFSKSEVCQQVLDGKLKLQDEVCLGNDYWFYLHEEEEVTRFLGVQVPRQRNRDDDDTQTETETQTQTEPGISEELTDPDLSRPAAARVQPTQPIQTAPAHAAQSPSVELQRPAAMAASPAASGAPSTVAYTPQDEEERTEVQSLDIGKELVARIPTADVESAAEPAARIELAPSAPLSAHSSREVDSAAQDISGPADRRRLKIFLALGFLAVVAAAFWYVTSLQQV